jgi:hypothetical protein
MMSNNYDVEMTKDAYGYLVECFECGKEFEALRSDVAFCSSTCRSRNHRKKFKLDKDIQKANDLISSLINRLPSSGESKTFIALNELSTKIDNALAFVESE